MADIVHLEQRETMSTFGERLCVSKSTLKRWNRQGCPHELIAGKVTYIPSLALAWLRDNGLIDQRNMEGERGAA